jgi:hypothetical protein
MLEVIAEALRSNSSKLIDEGPYQNREGIWGYYLTVWHAGHYHMISVSHTDRPQSPRDVAEALTSPAVQVYDSGNYRNRKGTIGYYATAKYGEHWYMVSFSDIRQPYHSQWWIDRWAFGSSIASGL